MITINNTNSGDVWALSSGTIRSLELVGMMACFAVISVCTTIISLHYYSQVNDTLILQFWFYEIASYVARMVERRVVDS
jgi:hypothetical protein